MQLGVAALGRVDPGLAEFGDRQLPGGITALLDRRPLLAVLLGDLVEIVLVPLRGLGVRRPVRLAGLIAAALRRDFDTGQRPAQGFVDLDDLPSGKRIEPKPGPTAD